MNFFLLVKFDFGETFQTCSEPYMDNNRFLLKKHITLADQRVDISTNDVTAIEKGNLLFAVIIYEFNLLFQ